MKAEAKSALRACIKQIHGPALGEITLQEPVLATPVIDRADLEVEHLRIAPFVSEPANELPRPGQERSGGRTRFYDEPSMMADDPLCGWKGAWLWHGDAGFGKWKAQVFETGHVRTDFGDCLTLERNFKGWKAEDRAQRALREGAEAALVRVLKRWHNIKAM